MRREFHVRFYEGVGVRFPRATRRLLGFCGPRTEAEAIKEKIAVFLKDELKLNLSEAKTLITHARTEAARFLGYEVTVIHNDNLMDQSKRRATNGNIGFKCQRSCKNV
jgi:hypothetical protein